MAKPLEKHDEKILQALYAVAKRRKPDYVVENDVNRTVPIFFHYKREEIGVHLALPDLIEIRASSPALAEEFYRNYLPNILEHIGKKKVFRAGTYNGTADEKRPKRKSVQE